ncbi:MAG: M15 family metallopeptidase [Rhodospirillales bacterium]|nr:M15 family metallopeptidase [Rhodospirillales bacterium]
MRSLLLFLLLLGLAGLELAGPAWAQESLHGHMRYPEAAPEDLVAVCTGNSPRLHKDAAQALRVMIEAARADGTDLRALSCFRSIQKQRYLFCRHVCDPRGQVCGKSCDGRRESEKARAQVSAPPGHSEHATGYAVDFADGRNRKCDFEICFGGTEASLWLAENAATFGFELSFPEDNAQGISFEPWHWRFVGTPEARQLFQAARQRYPASPAVR